MEKAYRKRWALLQNISLRLINFYSLTESSKLWYKTLHMHLKEELKIKSICSDAALYMERKEETNISFQKLV